MARQDFGTQCETLAAAGAIDASRFELVRELAKGGMATVYLARDLSTTPPGRVALKVMHAQLETEPALVQRFEHEVRLQAGLKHPHVVGLVGWGRDARGQIFMALEYVDGPTLRDLLPEGRRLPADLACHVALGMLRGLAHAHERGLVHRDVKPGNVMITRDGLVKIADFGVSQGADLTRLTSTGSVIGTPAYMSPEQALARPVDGRSDLFSVGVTLYEMLVGSHPFHAGNPATTLARVVHHQQRPLFETLPQTPALLEELIDALLQKDPEQRVASAEQAIEALERCIRDEDLAGSREAMAAFLTEPDATTRRLCQRRGKRCLEAGIRLYGGGQGPVEAAVWQLFLATVLDPGSAEARTWLEQVSRERGFTLVRKPHPRIDELEASLAKTPDNLAVILQLAKLHKSQGNFLQVIHYYRRAKALRPPDNYTRGQIQTLVPAHSAPLIDGTGMFETERGVPVRTRPAPVAPAGQPVADGWGDFMRGVLSTPWGKAAAVGSVTALMIVGGGWMFDRATHAARRATARHADVGSDVFDEQVAALEQGKGAAARGEHAAAEAGWRRFLEQWPGSRFATEARFRLGDALESQGQRAEALDVHAENARAAADEWTLASREHRGDILRVDGDAAGARAEYETVAAAASGEPRVRALLALAQVDRSSGRLSFARQDLEEAAAASEGTRLHDEARLALADFCLESGETQRAREIYLAVRETTDHRSETFHRATSGLDALGAAVAAEPVLEPEPEHAPAPSTGEDAAAPAAESGGDASEPAAAAANEAATSLASDAADAGEPAAGQASARPPATGLLTGLK